MSLAPGQWFFAQTNEGFRLIDTERESADELSKALLSNPKSVYVCAVSVYSFDEGFYAETEHREGVSLVITNYGGAPVPTEISAELQALTAKEYEKAGAPQSASDIRAGGSTRVRTIWFGHFLNFVTAACLICLPLSLRWVPGWLRNIPVSRRERQRAKGLCGSCLYDLRGDMGGVCPECGRRNDPGS